MSSSPSSGTGSANPSNRPQTLLQRFHRLSFRARFLTLSLLVHAVIVLLGGSAVIIQNIVPVADFEMAGGEIVNQAPDVAVPPDNPMPTLPPSDAQSLPTVTAPPVNAIASPVSKASFSLPSASMNTVKVGSGDMASLAKGLGSGVNGVAGKLGGTRYFGTVDKLPNALIGTFYDLKQDRRRKPTGVSPDDYHKIFREFVREGWRESLLNKYFRSPNRLYATQVFIPNMPADEGPKAFDMQKEVQPSRWLIHYQGRVSPPADGTYRFVGGGDDVLIVRFNGKVVLDRCWYQDDAEWKAERNYDYSYTKIPNGFARGDAVKVRAGELYDIEILIGEQPGGLVFFSLLMEQEGVEYQRDAHGNPILPIFRVADVPVPEPAQGQTFPPYAPNGPVWRAASIDRPGSAFDDFFGKK